MENDKERHSLATYVSDMLALERHVRIPFDAQNADDDFSRIGNASQIVIRLATTSDDHIEQLQGCLATLGGHEAAGIKNAISQLEGFVAGAIDKTRKTKVTKALRDDYTALALCSAGYTALLATANAMGETNVAAVASELLEDYAGLMVDIGRALPEIVVRELAAIGLDLDVTTAEASVQQVEQAWRARNQVRERLQTNSRGSIGPTDGAFSETTLAEG
jgi:ferritin-like metal-binding protein YciE